MKYNFTDNYFGVISLTTIFLEFIYKTLYKNYLLIKDELKILKCKSFIWYIKNKINFN